MSPCAKILKEAVGAGDITDKQADELVKRMANRAKARAEARGGNAYEKLGEIAGEMANEANLEVKLKERNALLNLSRRVDFQMKSDEAVKRGMTIADAAKAKEIGSVKKIFGGMESADAKALALKRRSENALKAEFQKLGIWHEASSGKMDDAFIDAWDNVDGADPKVKSALKQFESIIAEYYDRILREGGNGGRLEDWRLPQMWDSFRVRLLGVKGRGPELYRMLKKPDQEMARAAFMDIMGGGKLNAERTYNGADKDDYLGKVFKNFFYDNHHVPGEENPMDLRAITGGGPADRVTRPRLLHFNSAKDWWDAHKKIGKHGSIPDLMFATINRMAHTVALLETWGPGGKDNRALALQEAADRHRDIGSPPEVVDSIKSQSLEASWNVISGASAFSTRPLLSKIVDNAMVWSRWTTMGGSGLTAFITDKGTMVRMLKRVGMPSLDALASFTRFQMPRTDAEKRYARAFLSGIEGNLTSIATRFGDDLQLGRKMAKADRMFWRANGLEAFTAAHKDGAGEMLANWAAQHEDVPWRDLEPGLRDSYELSGIDEPLWDIYRKYGVGETTRGKFLAEDRFVTIPDSAINSLVAARGLKETGANRSRIKDEIRDRWREWITSETRFGVPEGTAREQALWMGTMRRGSWQAEIWKPLGLLKGFPLAMVNTIAARDLYSGGAGKLTEAIFSVNRGYYDVALTVAYTTALGYLSWTVKNALVGKGAPPLFDEEGRPNIDTYLGAMARGGGIGIADMFVAHEYDTRFRHWSSAALGPILGQADTLAAAFSQGIRGESIKPEISKLVEANTPFLNLFYLRWALNYTVLWSLKESLNPGFLERQRETFEKGGGSYSPLLPVLDPENRMRPFE